jgi:hypothetical protein
LPAPDPCVYFVQAAASDLIKIGYTGDWPTRRAALASANGDTLTTLAVVRPGSRRLEKQLHTRFATLRHHGEWFSPRPELLAYIGEIQAGLRRPMRNGGRQGAWNLSDEPGLDEPGLDEPDLDEPAEQNAVGPLVLRPDTVFTKDEFIQAFRLRASSVRREIKLGRLTVRERCGRYFFLGRDILAWIKGGEVSRPANAPDSGPDR